MKKWIAIILAALMTLATCACAETAAGGTQVLRLIDPQLNLTIDGQTQKIDMTGLEIALAAGLSGSTPTLQLDVANGSETLLSGVAQAMGNELAFTLEGMSHAYAVQAATGGMSLESAFATLLSYGGAMSNVKLPAFNGVSIPRLDLAALLGDLITGTGVNDAGAPVATFSLPYDQVNSALNMAMQYVEMYGGGQIPQLDTLKALLGQLTQGDSGFTINGEVADAEDDCTLTANFYPVSAGQQAEEPAFGLSLSSAENELLFQIMLYQSGNAVRLLALGIDSEPEAATLSADLDIMDEVEVEFGLYPEDGLQAVALSLDVNGKEMALGLAYGEKDGKDVFRVALTPDDSQAIRLQTEMAGGQGTLEASFAQGGQVFDLSAAIATGAENVTFRSIDPATVTRMETMTSADREAMQAELSNALAGIMSYVNALTPAA